MPHGSAWKPQFLREGYAVNDTISSLTASSRCHRRLVRAGARREVDETPSANWSPAGRSIDGPRLTGQSLRRCLPRHQDLVHQRGLRDLRSQRRRSLHNGRRDRVRQAHRTRVPQRRRGFRRRLPTRGHRVLHGAGRRARAPQALGFLAEVDAINMRRRAASLSWLASSSAARSSASRSPCSAPRSSPAPTTSTTPPPSRSRPDPAAGRACERVRPQGHAQRGSHVPDARVRTPTFDACDGADIERHLTGWQEFRTLDPPAVTDGVQRATLRRRPQLPRRRHVACGRLDLPRHGPAIARVHAATSL